MSFTPAGYDRTFVYPSLKAVHAHLSNIEQTSPEIDIVYFSDGGGADGDRLLQEHNALIQEYSNIQMHCVGVSAYAAGFEKLQKLASRSRVERTQWGTERFVPAGSCINANSVSAGVQPVMHALLLTQS